MMIESLALAGALAASLIGAELTARALLKRRDDWFVHRPFSRAEYTIDPEAFPMLPPTVHVSANPQGERGSPLPRKPEELYRILVAGGSAAECYMLDQPHTWPMVTQEILNGSAGRRSLAHVGNIACSLIPCRSITPLLNRILPRARSLDVIVLMVGASDLVDWFEKKTPPVIDGARKDLHLFCSEHPEGDFSWAPNRTALYRVGRRLQARVLKPVHRRSKVGAARIKHRAMRARCQTILTETPDPSPMLDAFRAHLTSLIALCKEHSAEVLIARQPWLDADLPPEKERQLWNFGQGRPYQSEPEAYYAISLVRALMAKVDAVAAEVAEAEGVQQLDLRARVPSDLDHYYDFLHHTPLGARCVGAAVADKLTEIESNQPN
ncbi:MAG: hypothetical protein P8M11_14505 [Planctomycetota bacterium]|nr:hypothetical protein [Planctomycetota bacterium]